MRPLLKIDGIANTKFSKGSCQRVRYFITPLQNFISSLHLQIEYQVFLDGMSTNIIGLIAKNYSC